MLKKIFEFLRESLFPPFSELELVTFFFLIFLSIIENPSSIGSLLDLLQETSRDLNPIEVFFFLLMIFLVGISIIIFLIKLVIHTFSFRKASLVEKELFSLFFYVFLSLITGMSILDFEKVKIESFYTFFEKLILIFVGIRSFLTFLLSFSLARIGKADFYAIQMSNLQINKKELKIIIFSSIIFYIFLRINHNSLSAILLSYFWVTTIVHLLRKLREKDIVNNLI